MIISGIKAAESFYNLNTDNSIVKSSPESAVAGLSSDASVSSDAAAKKQISQEEIDRARAGQTQDAVSFAQLYDPTAVYSMKGADSDLQSLDVVNAISQMQKDQMLTQYRFFVGTSNAEQVTEAVATRPVENFNI